VRQLAVQLLECVGHFCLKASDKAGRLDREIECGVVRSAPLLEISGKIVIGISIAIRADDPYLLAAQALTQCMQYADFVVYAVDTLCAGTVLFKDEIAPFCRDDAIEGEGVFRMEVLPSIVEHPLDPSQGSKNRPVAGIVRAKLEHIQ
jgi:hypothetical protein